jgi:hypothetical protein
MSKTRDLIDGRERRNTRLLFGENGWDGVPPALPDVSGVPNVLQVVVRCPTPNCGLDGRATVTNKPFQIEVDMRCPCEAANDPAWVAELRRQAVHEDARIRREARAAAEPEKTARPFRGRDDYKLPRGARGIIR